MIVSFKSIKLINFSDLDLLDRIYINICIYKTEISNNLIVILTFLKHHIKVTFPPRLVFLCGPGGSSPDLYCLELGYVAMFKHLLQKIVTFL